MYVDSCIYDSGVYTFCSRVYVSIKYVYYIMYELSNLVNTSLVELQSIMAGIPTLVWVSIRLCAHGTHGIGYNFRVLVRGVLNGPNRRRFATLRNLPGRCFDENEKYFVPSIPSMIFC